ncbi:hypothetical protein K2173_018632 [Erythroxylum novogranatense]|uniref:Uncharacterized protein n=1 Tax=Erythroxylum novogranatense TaxID=1862640 RepID=A0AAV8SAK7_9ROSI|nr:hypothetical protein K2173_018632 [Erythroxylum novogranatense]
MSDSVKPRTVRLWCPSMSNKVVTWVAWDDQKLDLGSIARAFGLDPSTLKLNGHFLSRGLDLVSSSVTWRSLLNFFSAKGLPTGENHKAALVIHGRLCKLLTKRTQDPQDNGCAINRRIESQGNDVSGRLPLREADLITNKKLKESNSGFVDYRVTGFSSVGLKRKKLMEDINLLKKLKINETSLDSESGKKCHSTIIPGRQFRCSYTGSGSSMKRVREDEALLAAPCKKMKWDFQNII